MPNVTDQADISFGNVGDKSVSLMYVFTFSFLNRIEYYASLKKVFYRHYQMVINHFTKSFENLIIFMSLIYDVFDVKTTNIFV